MREATKVRARGRARLKCARGQEPETTGRATTADGVRDGAADRGERSEDIARTEGARGAARREWDSRTTERSALDDRRGVEYFLYNYGMEGKLI